MAKVFLLLFVVVIADSFEALAAHHQPTLLRS